MWGGMYHVLTEFCPTTTITIPGCTRCFWILLFYIHRTCSFTANICNKLCNTSLHVTITKVALCYKIRKMCWMQMLYYLLLILCSYEHFFGTVPSACSSWFVDCGVVGSVAIGSWTILFLFVVWCTLLSVVAASPDVDSFPVNTGTVCLTVPEP